MLLQVKLISPLLIVHSESKFAFHKFNILCFSLDTLIIVRCPLFFYKSFSTYLFLVLLFLTWHTDKSQPFLKQHLCNVCNVIRLKNKTYQFVSFHPPCHCKPGFFVQFDPVWEVLKCVNNRTTQLFLTFHKMLASLSSNISSFFARHSTIDTLSKQSSSHKFCM